MAEPLKVALLAMNAPGYQSLAIAYLRAFAEADTRLTWRVAFQSLDLSSADDPWWVAYRIIALEPDVLGASVLCWNARAIYDVCRIVQEALPGITIVLGGPEVGPIADDVLREHQSVDAVVRGEGEAAFADILDLLRREKPLTRADGVTARDGSGEPQDAPDRPLDSGPGLDTLALPERCAAAAGGHGVHRGLPWLSAPLRLLLRGQGLRAHTVVQSVARGGRDRLPRRRARRAQLLVHRSGLQPHSRAPAVAERRARPARRTRADAAHGRGRHRAHR